MNNRNVLKIVAGVLLVASLPAGAQVLGGGLGGAANGALGGGLGQGIHGSGGIVGGGSITGPDAVGAAGKARDRVQQAGQRTKDAAGKAKGAVDSARSGNGTVNGAASSSASRDGLLLDGATSGGIDKQVAGRDVAASGSGAATGRADRSGLDTSVAKQADVSAKKSEPAAAPAP